MNLRDALKAIQAEIKVAEENEISADELRMAEVSLINFLGRLPVSANSLADLSGAEVTP